MHGMGSLDISKYSFNNTSARATFPHYRKLKFIAKEVEVLLTCVRTFWVLGSSKGAGILHGISSKRSTCWTQIFETRQLRVSLRAHTHCAELNFCINVNFIIFDVLSKVPKNTPPTTLDIQVIYTKSQKSIFLGIYRLLCHIFL